MDGEFTGRVYCVMLGCEVTPKVAGVTKDDIGMHLDIGLSPD